MYQNNLEDQPKEVIMNFKLSRQLFNNLKNVCKKEHRSKSMLLRMIINNYTAPRL
jgi:predicted DNA-binding protein